MTKTHFRCRVFGLLAVAACRANRKLPTRLRTGSGHWVGDRVCPLVCRGCAQARDMDAGREPTLTTLAEIERALLRRKEAS